MNNDLEIALEYVEMAIGRLEDDYQHYTMVDKNKIKAYYANYDLEKFQAIKRCLDKLKGE